NRLFLVLILLSAPHTAPELVRSMSDCGRFLLEGSPPQISGILEGGNILNQNRYKAVCQTFQDERRFVTLYDTHNRIAVFSAAKYRGEDGTGRPSNTWKIEPQARNADYKNNGAFDRGHLIPSSYGLTKADRQATFTLTNVVPQARSFNQGSWMRMESCIKCVMDTFCINSNGLTEAFVVTGAEPSPDNVLANRVNVPSMLWSAFCCYSSNNNRWMASAHWADNSPDESKDEHLETKTLEELQKNLRASGGDVQVFPGTQCPLHTTVTELYPQIPNCRCPTAGTSAYRSTSGSVRSSAPGSVTRHTTSGSVTRHTTSGSVTRHTTSGSVTTTAAPPPVYIWLFLTYLQTSHIWPHPR
uniref:Uncharacterized protein n=1 Tax=Echeneis naucrates TaxID=173247 RepID=A0A665T958_ECHNA